MVVIFTLCAGLGVGLALTMPPKYRAQASLLVESAELPTVSDLFILSGVPSFIRSDNAPEFVAQAVRDWIAAVGAKTAYRAGITMGKRPIRCPEVGARQEMIIDTR